MRASIVCLLLTAACGGRPEPAAPAPAAAAVTLAEVEAALLGAPAWRAEVHITATAPYPAVLDAVVLATRDNRVSIEARGDFAGVAVDARWVSDGQRTSTGEPAPKFATEAVALGMTRMGLLHNLAMVIRGRGPDHAEGGVREWIVPVDPRATGPGAITFTLAVDGVESAEIALEIDPEARVMRGRRIVVHFDEGDMVVEERYRFDLAVALPPDAFVTGGGP